MATTPNKTKAGATDAAPATRAPAPAIDFKAIKPQASEEGRITHSRATALDNTPIPAWLAESWAGRKEVTLGSNTVLEGLVKALPAMTKEQVDHLKKLMQQGVQQMPGVGVKFKETMTPDGVVLQFQTKQRKARKAKA